MFRWGVPLAAALLAGCAAPPAAGDAEPLSSELVRLSGIALATASTGEDLRAVMRQALGAGPRTRVVQIAGHRFLLAPATLDAMPAGSPYRWLLAQSLEFAEQSCVRFALRGAEGWRTQSDGTGAIMLGLEAEAVQWVNVAIELRQGCIVALHVEQASALARE